MTLCPNLWLAHVGLETVNNGWLKTVSEEGWGLLKRGGRCWGGGQKERKTDKQKNKDRKKD